MRIKDLISEAPIDQFQTFNMDKEGTFTDQDKKMITRPERVEKARRYFENTPFVFNLFFVNVDLKGANILGVYDKFLNQFYTGRILTKQEVKNELGVEVPFSQNSISVVFLSNYADSAFPLTPWMMAHRFTHTIINDSPYDTISSDDPLVEEAVKRFQTHVKQFIHVVASNKDVNFTKFLTMKTARDNELSLEKIGGNDDIQEISQEMLSEFIIKGRIGFVIPDELSGQNSLNLVKLYKSAIDSINTSAKLLLKSCVGKIFVMP